MTYGGIDPVRLAHEWTLIDLWEHFYAISLRDAMEAE